MDGLQKAIDHFGSQAALARALGVVPMAVSNWKDRRVPAEQCKAIEDATAGAVKRHELRPDIFAAPGKGRAA